MSASSKKKLRKEQKAAALTQKQLQQQKEAKKLKVQTATFITIIALVLVIGIGSLAVTAYKNSGIIERSTTAVTIGEHKLSTAELSYFYFDLINSSYNSWYETYGDYTATYMSILYGLDMTAPLDEQMYDEEKGITYADYFVDAAVQEAINVYGMYDLAVVSDKLGEVEKEYLDFVVENAMDNMELASQEEGYGSLQKYLKAHYGNGATVESFRKYAEVLNTAELFQTETYDAFTYTEDDLTTYDQEHPGEFSSYSFATFYVSVNDNLVCTADEEDTEHEHTQEEKDQAQLNAKEVVTAFENAEISSVEEFNAFIQTLDVYKDDEDSVCIENTDLLYGNVDEDDVAQWLADESRKAGDLTVFTRSNETTDEDGNTVSTPYGYDVILYLDRNENEMKLVNVRHILKSFTETTTDPEGNTVYIDEDERKEEITKLMNDWTAGDASEDAFATLASTETDDTGSLLNGGLYENVYPGQMVSAFNDWCFDEARQPGDYEIIRTDYGYHLMYFSGHSAVTYRSYMIENALRDTDYNAWYQEQVDAVQYTVNDLSKMRTDISFSA